MGDEIKPVLYGIDVMGREESWTDYGLSLAGGAEMLIQGS